MSNTPTNQAWALYDADTGEFLAFQLGSCRDCMMEGELCDFRYAEWLDDARTKRKPILWIPGKGPTTATASPDTSETATAMATTTAPAPWWFRIRAIDIPPNVKDEEELVRRRRTLQVWAERRALKAARPPRIRPRNRNPERVDSDSQRPKRSPSRTRMEPVTTVTAPQAETSHTVETRSEGKKRLIASEEMGTQEDEQRPTSRARVSGEHGEQERQLPLAVRQTRRPIPMLPPEVSR
jgi:hypothetical protein